MKKFLFFIVAVFVFISNNFAQNYKLVWSDEFKVQLNQTYWTYETGNSNGWGNNELEYYTNRPQNCVIQNGNLIISALKENYNNFNYTSARIKTQNKFSIRYGKIEARMKLPYGQGIWPAFWMLGDNITQVGWPTCGEIDIMEMIGGNQRDNTVYGSAHWGGDYSKAYKLTNGKFADDFHIFDVTWTPQQIQWHVDGITYNTLDVTNLSAFQKSFFIIINLAVGGSWPGNPDNTTIFPQTLQVDYLRVYQDTTAFPVVSITSPKDQTHFQANKDIIINASASMQNGNISKVEFYQGSEKIGETFTNPYQMTLKNVYPGKYKITCKAYSSNGLMSFSDTTNVIVDGSYSSSPYGGNPAHVPGKIEAEDFDLGGEGNAYHDSDIANNGGQYRINDGVDIELCTDTGGGYDIGWTQNDEWLLYTITVQESASFQITSRVSSNSGGGTLHYEIDGSDVTGVISVPNTNGWQTWQDVVSKTFTISAGIHKLKLYINSAGFNINNFQIYSPNSSPAINFIYPTGGEQFIPDSVIEISWNSLKVDNVNIGYSTNGGKFWASVQNNLAARYGVYRWKIPQVNSAQCKLIIVSGSNSLVMDTSKNFFTIGNISSAGRKGLPPLNFSLNQNYPNPFNPSTIISYSVGNWGNSGYEKVRLKVYDITGREIATLVDEDQSPGNYFVKFDASMNSDHYSLPSGIYFYRLTAGNFSSTKKLVLLK